MWLLSVDLGEASLGWTAFRLDLEQSDPVALMDGGIRLFSNARDPQNNQPLNVARREARGMRRNKERRLMRHRNVEACLVHMGLLRDFDHDVRSIDPYFARNLCADPTQVATAAQLSRAMLHLAKSRGFKSNRKADKASESEFLAKQTALEQALGEQTLGQFLYTRQQRELAQVRAAKASGRGFHHRKGLRFRSEDGFHPTRAMLEAEFDAICQAQSAHHALTPEQWAKLRGRIFYQRPLKPQDRGKCTLYPTKDRALKALPTAEAFRIEQQLSNLRFRRADRSEAPLTPDQRDAVRAELYRVQRKTFGSLLKLKGPDKQPLFPDAVGFNLGESRDNLEGAKTYLALAKVLGEDRLDALSDLDKDRLVEQMIEADDDLELVKWLMGEGLDKQTAQSMSTLSFASGTTNLCLYAMTELLGWLKSGLRYDDAVRELKDDQGRPLHHSVLAIERLPEGAPLPYYGALLPSSVIGGRPGEYDAQKDPEGHFGRIQNATVHVALNQLRVVVNQLIKRYGHPTRVHIELAREMSQGEKARNEEKRKQAQNRKKNERLNAEAQRCGAGEHPSRNDRIKVELWELINPKDPVDRRCVFTGQQIAGHQLFNGEVDVEHLLPYSQTLDDRKSNKVLAMRWANALKGNKTPFQAFGSDQHADKGIVWAEVLERSRHLPSAWRWRFGEDAMQRFTDDPKNGFVARSLNDTRYMARVAKRYLEAVTKEPVVVVTGQHTANLRHDWGLNDLLLAPEDRGDPEAKKNRDDHRHHMIDAFVIGLTSRSTLQSMAKEAKRKGPQDKFRRGHHPLDPSLKDQLVELLDRVVISVKPDRSGSGKFLDETAYGIKQPLEGMEPERNRVTRVNVVGIRTNPEAILGTRKLKGICDPAIRQALDLYLARAEAEGVKEKAALKAFLNGPLVDMIEVRQIKRLRVLIKDQSAEPVGSAPYKAYAKASYAFADIWFLPANRKQKKDLYRAQYIDMATGMRHLSGGDPLPAKFNVNDPSHPHHHPAAKRLMRLFKNDILELDTDNGRELFRVYGFSATDNKMKLGALNSTRPDKSFTSVNVIGNQNPKRVFVDPDGSIRGRNR